MKKAVIVVKKLLIFILALQLLNLSICSEAYWDDYDYAYSSANTYDPTETIVEWVVEMKYGQQNAFSYDAGIEKKITAKSFHWQTDFQKFTLTVVNNTGAENFGPALISCKIKLPTLEIISPPPELPNCQI